MREWPDVFRPNDVTKSVCPKKWPFSLSSLKDTERIHNYMQRQRFITCADGFSWRKMKICRIHKNLSLWRFDLLKNLFLFLFWENPAYTWLNCIKASWSYLGPPRLGFAMFLIQGAQIQQLSQLACSHKKKFSNPGSWNSTEWTNNSQFSLKFNGPCHQNGKVV